MHWLTILAGRTNAHYQLVSKISRPGCIVIQYRVIPVADLGFLKGGS